MSPSSRRACGSRAVICATSLSTSAGMSATRVEGAGTSSWTFWKAIWMGESAVKGWWPVSSSKRIMPTE